jgi:pyruvate dehydrogenase E1 component
VSYDPAYGYEIAHIMRDGLRRMYGEALTDRAQRHLLPHGLQRADASAAEPEDVDVDGILKGMHLLRPGRPGCGR